MMQRESTKINLGVNVDHIATLRQARGGLYPDPVAAALRAEKVGADSITMHLREDRRHIQKDDIYKFSNLMLTHLNLEMAITEEMLEIACDLKPRDCCLVPESRQELTTEGGLNVINGMDSIKKACQILNSSEIRVSLFIDPDIQQIDATLETSASVIELHTGAYADADESKKQYELNRIIKSACYASDKGLIVHAGHGLNYQNVIEIAKIGVIQELNIGHSIIARAVNTGIAEAVSEMKSIMIKSRK